MTKIMDDRFWGGMCIFLIIVLLGTLFICITTITEQDAEIQTQATEITGQSTTINDQALTIEQLEIQVQYMTETGDYDTPFSLEDVAGFGQTIRHRAEQDAFDLAGGEVD